MKKARNEYYSPLPAAMRFVLAAGCAGCLLSALMYGRFGSRWMYSCAITCGMIAYHMLMRFLSPVLLGMVFHRQYNCNAAWFQPKPWEEKLYRRLKVHKWKGRALTYAPDEFSLRLHTLEEIINNMCHAEAVHELIVVLSLGSMVFAVPFGSFAAFAVTAVLAALFDSMFIVIQRYNRPRLMQIAQRRNKNRSR